MMFRVHQQSVQRRKPVGNGREMALSRRLLAGVTLFAVSATVVDASPTGGVVVGGPLAATITQPDANTTNIAQHKQRVDISWTGFDTTPGQSVNFTQPDATSLAINRISGSRTQFNGSLNANGRIFLINQNGITFGPGSQVNVGSLLATTSTTDPIGPISDPESYAFHGAGNYASVVNEGDITVSDGGFAVLAAPYVVNRGLIKADLGQVELASTNDYTIKVDLRGDGLITFDSSGEWLTEETNPLGVTSSGTLQARSGQVYLTANMASEIVQGVVNLSGIVDADQFVGTPDGGLVMVSSVGDINIGGGADIHAVGGEKVAAGFYARRDINMGAGGDPARITLKAESATDAAASLEMVAASEGGAGTLAIADAVIEVTANTSGSPGSSTSATATAILEGAEVGINADITVGSVTGGDSGDNDALAVLDVFANGDIEYDTSHNAIGFGDRGNLTMLGNIDVSAESTAVNNAGSKATANAVLAASGATAVTSEINVDAVSKSDLPQSPEASDLTTGPADANAALVMLGGTPAGLLGLLRDVSLNKIDSLGTLSDILTFANHEDVLDFFSFVDDPVGFLDLLGGIGSDSVSYTGNSKVNALANYNASGANGLAEATAAGYFAAGGDVHINTDPITVDSQAIASQSDTESSGIDTDARSALVAAAGLRQWFYGDSDGGLHSVLTVRGDLSTRAQETLNGDYNRYAGALTALVAPGDITVRGADPLAVADPATVQGRSSRWQVCRPGGCSPVTAGILDPSELTGISPGDDSDYLHLAQLIIESLYGDIDIQPKFLTGKVQPAGLFTDPIGPGWPGDLPLRFDASGRMLVATGVDATRPPQIIALDGGIEAAILAGADPGALLPPTASGGCVATGRDAFTISAPDFFDRMISASCESRE